VNVAYIVMWEFLTKPGEEASFEHAYGPDGDWVQLFRRDPRYMRTDLMRDIENPRRYFTLDYWQSQEAYDEFRAQHEQEYKRIDAHCEEVTESEQLIGKFITIDSVQARQ